LTGVSKLKIAFTLKKMETRPAMDYQDGLLRKRSAEFTYQLTRAHSRLRTEKVGRPT
jgi:hypothetical protein